MGGSENIVGKKIEMDCSWFSLRVKKNHHFPILKIGPLDLSHVSLFAS